MFQEEHFILRRDLAEFDAHLEQILLVNAACPPDDTLGVNAAAALGEDDLHFEGCADRKKNVGHDPGTARRDVFGQGVDDRLVFGRPTVGQELEDDFVFLLDPAFLAALDGRPDKLPFFRPFCFCGAFPFGLRDWRSVFPAFLPPSGHLTEKYIKRIVEYQQIFSGRESLEKPLEGEGRAAFEMDVDIDIGADPIPAKSYIIYIFY